MTPLVIAQPTSDIPPKAITILLILIEGLFILAADYPATKIRLLFLLPQAFGQRACFAVRTSDDKSRYMYFRFYRHDKTTHHRYQKLAFNCLAYTTQRAPCAS
jgi:hypothetical protein